MIISTYEETVLGRIQHSFITKIFNKLEIEGNFFNLIKDV